MEKTSKRINNFTVTHITPSLSDEKREEVKQEILKKLYNKFSNRK